MHDVVEQRSLRYHTAIAARLIHDGNILPKIRERVDQWISNGTVARFYAEGWKEMLARPLPELLAFLCDESQRARSFRQVSPFAGILSPKERWQIWANTRTSDDETTFDPRGTGDSRPEHLRGYEAAFTSWGQRDMPAALAFLHARFPALPKFVVGHSLGGQLTGLMPNHELLSGVVLLFAGTGYVFGSDAGRAVQGLLFLYVYLPLAVRLCSYGPCRLLTGGEDLPAGVVQEWMRWSSTRRWMPGHVPPDQLLHSKFKLPVLVFGLEHDRVSPPRNCRSFAREYFSNAAVEYSLLPQRGARGKRLRHLGYFSAGHDADWQAIAAWLDRQLHRAHDYGQRADNQIQR